MSFQGRVRGRGRAYHYRNSRNNERVSKIVSPTPAQDMSKQNTGNISKHDNNCCQEISISLELDENGTIFLAELKNMWNMLKKSPPVINKLHQYFSILENPYVQSLRLLYNCQEFHIAKSKTLPMFIIEEFKCWTLMSRNKIVHLLNPQLKIDAFKVVMKQNTLTLTKLIFEIYEMTQDSDIFLDIIRCMIEKKQYKEACQYATLLNLQDKFSIDDFLVPLVLQDKLFGVDDFLKASPKHQVDLVVFLDSILGNASVRETMGDYVTKYGIPEVKFEKLHAKPWKKLIARLLKMFKLSSDLTPNLNKRRNEGALNFLLHKRFTENNFGDESWKEMVQEAVGDDEELQKELIYQVAHYGDTSEALRWAHFYNIDRKDWPYNVRMLEENPDGNRPQQRMIQSETDSWDDEIQAPEPVEYHKFPLASSDVYLVDSPLGFESFLDTGLQEIDIVGIDCEWKPSFGSHPSELALIQIATRKNVFVLDIVNLGNKVPHLWQELGKFLFNNCDILKLGFSLTGDIHMIRRALPYLNFTVKQVGFLDLCSLWKHLDKFPKVKLPYEVQKGGPSLSTLVHHCLGRPLDKSDQFSNWEKRPLRESQIEYAALDAFCLIQVYDVLKKSCEDAEFPFEENCYSLMTNEKMARKKPKKVGNKKKQNDTPNKEVVQPASPQSTPVPACKIKVVCDTMLQGLGKKLRSCGIDSTILETHEDHMLCVKYAQDEQRYILTKGYDTFRMLNGYVPSGYCLKIISDDVDEQIREVLDYYKVIVTKHHVFSRCQACNGNSFVKVSRSTMDALIKSSEADTCPPPADYYEDEATGFSSEDDYEEATPSHAVNRKWELYPDEKVDVGLCQTRTGQKIQVKAVPKPLIDKYDFFYICEECGKVYWDGTHFERVLAGRLQGIVQ
ncbi:exonuclease mut-7 homolog [Anoplophora glabripennis]|uniref:exonuclease mut-7 homolog n=1 Tax=Anoplophora glabripennis TaxID=217634 RepID=UPI000874E6BE|nr:exonuclease mut-7 homolog [Anoplophora glabripennis]XP_018564100.1 exonuclease mut-7 homolog [Anoplophora glabripennis]